MTAPDPIARLREGTLAFVNASIFHGYPESIPEDMLAALDAVVKLRDAAREAEKTLRAYGRGVQVIGARHKLYDALALFPTDTEEQGTARPQVIEPPYLSKEERDRFWRDRG